MGIKKFQTLFTNQKGKKKSNFNAVFRTKITDVQSKILSNVIQNKLKDVKLINMNFEKHKELNIDDI